MKKNHIYLIIFFVIIFFLIILVTKNKITFINNFYVDKNNENKGTEAAEESSAA